MTWWSESTKPSWRWSGPWFIPNPFGHEFWAEMICNAMYMRNQCVTKAVDGKTLEEAWSRRMPHVSHMHVFGCVPYAKVLDQRQMKLDTKGIKCLNLGYCEGIKAYRLICLEMKKIIKSPDVVFFKDKTHTENCSNERVEDTRGQGGHVPQIGRGGLGCERQHFGARRGARHRGGCVPAAKSTRSEESSKVDFGKKPQPNHLHHCNMAMKQWAILGTRIGHVNCLENGGRTTFRNPKTKNMQT